MDEKYQTNIWRKVKKLYQTHFAPLLSLFFLLSCVLGTKNVAKFGQGGEIFFCTLRTQIKTRFACELTRCARATNMICEWNFCSYFNNFLFLENLAHPPPLAEVLRPPLSIYNVYIHIFILGCFSGLFS